MAWLPFCLLMLIMFLFCFKKSDGSTFSGDVECRVSSSFVLETTRKGCYVGHPKIAKFSSGREKYNKPAAVVC